MLVLVSAPLAACGSATEEPSNPGASEASVNPDAPPFAVKLDGPEIAGVGDQVTVTITNVGRLPDAYQIVPEPTGAAKIAEPNFHASPEESVDVKVTVKQTPLTLVVKSIGGGQGEPVGQLTIK